MKIRALSGLMRREDTEEGRGCKGESKVASVLLACGFACVFSIVCRKVNLTALAVENSPVFLFLDSIPKYFLCDDIKWQLLVSPF